MCVPLGFRPDLARFASGKATSVKSALAGRLSKMHGGAKFNKVHNKAVALKDGTLVRRHSRAAVAPARLACLGASPHGHGHTLSVLMATRAHVRRRRVPRSTSRPRISSPWAPVGWTGSS